MMVYELELDRVVKQIAKSRAKLVCIQLPDGLKPKAAIIQDKLESKTDANVLIWANSCFGACDIPELKDVDLLIQWGHSEWSS